MSNKVCCVPECSNSVAGSKDVLHKFPNPDKDRERFNTWLYSIGSDILGLSNDHIFKYRRVCRRHFDEKYWCRNNLLSKTAVPTKNLPGPFKSIQNLSEASTSKGIVYPEFVDVQMKENNEPIILMHLDSVAPETMSQSAKEYVEITDIIKTEDYSKA